MTERLNTNLTVLTLARDLGLRASGDAVSQIVKFCQSKVNGMLSDMTCKQTPSSILSLTAARLETEFIEVHSCPETDQAQREFLQRGETGFAFLRQEFGAGVLGITVRRLNRLKFERRYISVINSCGRNRERAYFTKWHELVHLLTLTDQTRLSFRRTHVAMTAKDPEESLVDVVAGNLAFHSPLVKPYANKTLSFELVDQIRSEVFPDASRQAGLLGITRAWPHPCILIRAALAAKRNGDPEEQVLRAVNVSVNQPAIDEGVIAIPNFRVPQRSVLYSVFRGEKRYGEATEDLESWASTSGRSWAGGAFRVRALATGDCVQAIITRK